MAVTYNPESKTGETVLDVVRARIETIRDMSELIIVYHTSGLRLRRLPDVHEPLQRTTSPAFSSAASRHAKAMLQLEAYTKPQAGHDYGLPGKRRWGLKPMDFGGNAAVRARVTARDLDCEEGPIRARWEGVFRGPRISWPSAAVGTLWIPEITLKEADVLAEPSKMDAILAEAATVNMNRGVEEDGRFGRVTIQTIDPGSLEPLVDIELLEA